MKRNFSKSVAVGRRSKRQPKPKTTTDVTPDQVIKDLLYLFSRLGIDAPAYIAKSINPSKPRSSTRQARPYSSAIGELLTLWYQRPEYLDRLGNPIPIKFQGARKSFLNLAREAVPNISASKLLTELERLGAISVDRSKFISVHMRSLPVYEDKRLATQHTLTSLDGFIKTLHHNLDSTPANSDQLFHRIAWTGDFDPRRMPALKVRMKRRGQQFLESFDNWLSLKSLPKPRSSTQGKGRNQVFIGVYLSVT